MLQMHHALRLQGNVDNQGDLKSVVLHDMTIENLVSSFPISLGTNITTVDENTYSSTGEAFSMVVLVSTTHHSTCVRPTLYPRQGIVCALLRLLVCSQTSTRPQRGLCRRMM